MSTIRQWSRAASLIVLIGSICSGVSVGGFLETAEAADPFFINHFSLLPGDPTKLKTTASANIGFGSLSPGLVIESLQPGTVESVVLTALTLGRNTTVQGMRVCYELSNPRSYINNVTLKRVNDPGQPRDNDDEDNELGPDLPLQNQSLPVLNASVAHCTSFKDIPKGIKAQGGAIILSLGVLFADQSDKIVIRSLAVRIPSSAGGGF